MGEYLDPCTVSSFVLRSLQNDIPTLISSARKHTCSAKNCTKDSYRQSGGPERSTVARVINVAASLPHFWMSLSTLMIRLTRTRGNCVVGSLAGAVFLTPGGGVGDMVRTLEAMRINFI